MKDQRRNHHPVVSLSTAHPAGVGTQFTGIWKQFAVGTQVKRLGCKDKDLSLCKDLSALPKRNLLEWRRGDLMDWYNYDEIL
jgi:hypothetical protein